MYINASVRKSSHINQILVGGEDIYVGYTAMRRVTKNGHGHPS